MAKRRSPSRATILSRRRVCSRVSATGARLTPRGVSCLHISLRSPRVSALCFNKTKNSTPARRNGWRFSRATSHPIPSCRVPSHPIPSCPGRSSLIWSRRVGSPKEIASSGRHHDESRTRQRVINLINDRFARPGEDARADNAYETDDVTCRDVLLARRIDNREAEGFPQRTRTTHLHATR